MYKWFRLKNFRCFPELSIEDIGRVNLIVGPNNVGKTALLEALFIHIGPSNQTLATKLNAKRGITSIPLSAQDLWGSLFHDFELDSPVELVGGHADGTQYTIRFRITYPLTTIEMQKGVEATKQPSDTSEMHIGEDIVFEYEDGDGIKSRKMSITPEGIKVEPAPGANPFPGFYTTSRQFYDPKEYANRFGQLKVARRDHSVLDALRIIEPRLKSLSIIPIADISTIHADIGGNRLMPLQLAGEGMVRLAVIAINIASAPNGVTLIDEIENGLYYGVMVDVWKAVATMTRQLDVQVFATTHSHECIMAANQAFEESNQSDFRLHRLERIDDTIRAVTYDRDTLGAALESGLEIR